MEVDVEKRMEIACEQIENVTKQAWTLLSTLSFQIVGCDKCCWKMNGKSSWIHHGVQRILFISFFLYPSKRTKLLLFFQLICERDAKCCQILSHGYSCRRWCFFLLLCFVSLQYFLLLVFSFSHCSRFVWKVSPFVCCTVVFILFFGVVWHWHFYDTANLKVYQNSDIIIEWSILFT